MPTLTLEGRAPLLSGRAPISWAPDHIDLSGLEWATPYDIVALAVICTRLAEQNQRPSLVLPEDKQVRSYLAAVGLATVIGGQWDDADAPLTGDPPLIPLVRLTAPDAWDDLLAGQWPDVLGTLVAPGLAVARYRDTRGCSRFAPPPLCGRTASGAAEERPARRLRPRFALAPRAWPRPR